MMRVSRLRPLMVAAAAAPLFLASCRHDQTTEAPSADRGPSDATLVKVTRDMLPSIHVEPPKTRTVPMVLQASGKVSFDERRVARVVAPVAGQVMDLTANVGDHVRRGQPLFLLRSRDAATAIEDHFDSHRDLDLAEKTYAMTKDLYEHEAASRMALHQAENDLEKARARVTRAEGALTAIGLQPEHLDRVDPRVPVTSPVAGTVIERHVTQGQYLQPDPNPLLVIADLSTLWIEADVFERDLHVLRLGQPGEVSTAAYPDERFHAKIARISDVVDPSTQTVKVRFEVANPEGRLKPEMFTRVTLGVGNAAEALTVPASAVITEGTRNYVYVALDDCTFAQRAVDVSSTEQGSRRVLSGLKKDDRVVTNGVVLLRGQQARASR